MATVVLTVLIALIVCGICVVVMLLIAPQKTKQLMNFGRIDERKRDTYVPGKVKRKSDSRRLSHRYVNDGPFMFISGRGVWTGLRLSTNTDEFSTAGEQEMSAERKSAMAQELLDFFAARSTAREAELACHEIIRNQPVDTSDWVERYGSQHWDPTPLFETLLTDKVEPHIRDAAPVRANYLMIRIGTQKGPTEIDPVARVVNASDGVADEIFTTEELNYFRNLAAEVLHRMSAYGHEMTRADLAWLIRKPLSGTFPVETERDYLRTRYARGSWFDQLADFHGENLKRQAAVRITDPHHDGDGDPDTCVTTTLVVEESQAVVPFMYTMAWAAVLRSMPNPPEISWRYLLISEKLWRAKILKATRDIATEAKDRVNDGNETALDDTKFGAIAEQADETRRRMELQPQPGMVGQLRISISAPTLAELRIREQEVGDVMKQFATLRRPKNIQAALLEEQIPGDFSPVNIGKMVLCKDFSQGGGIDIGTRYSDLDVLSISRLDSASTVGDDIEFDRDGTVLGWHGQVIGYAAQNGAIVHFDPFVQMARNGGAGTAIIGASGGGKSSLSMSLFFFLSESGVQTVVLDPKNDFEQYCLYIAFGSQVLHDEFAKAINDGTAGTPGSPFQPINRRFWDDTRIVSLTHGNNGSLEPWRMTGDYDAGEQLARRQVEHLFSDLDGSSNQRNVIDKAFDNLRRQYQDRRSVDETTPLPALADLAALVGEELEFYDNLRTTPGSEIPAQHAYDEVRSVQSRLERARRQEYSRLLFDDSTTSDNDAIRGFAHRRTVITMIGFKPPANEQDAMATEQNRAAAAALYTVLWQVERLFSATGATISPHRRRKGIRPRLLIVDEAYVITAFAAGADLLNRALRQGRSFFFAVLIICQQARDIRKIEDAGPDRDDADQNQFGTVFVFGQRGDGEARAALKLLRSETRITAEEEQMLASQLLPTSKSGTLETGVCVMRDFDNRVASVHVDQLFNELRNAAETNAVLKPDRQSIDPPADPADWTINTSTRDRMLLTRIPERISDAREMVAAERFEFDDLDELTRIT